MPIASNRTGSKNLVDLVNKDHISAVDRTKDLPSNSISSYKPLAASSKLADKIGKKNIFSTDKPLEIGNELLSVSIFPSNGDPTCDQGASKRPKNSDDRRLDAPKKNSGCPTTSDSSLVLGTVLAHVTSGLPEHMVVAIETMVGSQVTTQSRGATSLGSVNKGVHILKGVSSVSKALSEVGTTIKEKANLKSLLGCMQLSGFNSDESRLILNVVIAGLLTQALCMSVNKMIATIVDIAANGNAVNGDIITNVIGAFAGATKKSPADKTRILTQAAMAIGGLTATDNAIMSGQGNVFMRAISSSSPTTNSPSSEHINTLAALDTVDPSWNKDANGNTNLSSTKGNNYMAKASKAALLTRSIPAASIPDNPVLESPTDTGFLAKLIVAANVSGKQITNGNAIPL